MKPKKTVYKKGGRLSSLNLKIKININEINNKDENNISYNDNSFSRKKVRFLTNELRMKEDMKLEKISPFKISPKNSILKNSKKKIDEYFKKLTQLHQFYKFDKSKIMGAKSDKINNKSSGKNDSNLLNKENKINVEKQTNYSGRSFNLKRKEKNKYIFSPFSPINRLKNKNFIKRIIKFPNIKNSIKTKKNESLNNIGTNLINKLYDKSSQNSNFSNNFFQTSINDINNKSRKEKKSFENEKDNTNKYSITENNFYPKKFNASKIKLTKHKDKSIINYNILITKFREYQKQIEPCFSMIKNAGKTLSRDINNNPFMRKIDNLRDRNEFNIVFHKSIMNNILEIQQKSKTGFFQGECCGINTNKDRTGGYYICENRSNIFNVSEMIDRMNPLSLMKFNELLRKDYKEFLGYNKKNYRKNNLSKKDKLREKLIRKYHKELFYQNDLAEKLNIKKNSGIKFIKDKDENIEKTNSDY